MLKKIINTGAIRVIGLLITFAIGVVVSRVFGAEGKGELTILVLIPTLISVYLGLSINEGFLYYLGKDKISRNNLKQLLGLSFVVFVPLFCAVYILVYFLITSYDYYFAPQIMLSCAMFFTLISKFSLRGVMDFRAFNFVQFLEPVLVLILVVVIILFELEVSEILWAYVISNIVVIVYSYNKVEIVLGKVKEKLNLRTIVNYSYKVHFFKILNFTENKFDVLIIGYFLSLSQVGIYSISVAITVIFQAIVQTSISTVLLPTLIKTKGQERDRLTASYFKISLSLAIIFLVGLFVFGEYFIVFVYGEEFNNAFLPMIVLAVGAVIKSPTACLNSFFKASGRPEELYKTSIYSVLLNIVLCFILIPIYGILGAAIASSISYFLYGIIMIFKFINATEIRVNKLILIDKKEIQDFRKSLLRNKK